MLVGRSGLGKKTLINSLFLTNFDDNVLDEDFTDPTGVRLISHSSEIVERAVKLKLKVVIAKGFGDAIDNSNCNEV